LEKCNEDYLKTIKKKEELKPMLKSTTVSDPKIKNEKPFPKLMQYIGKASKPHIIFASSQYGDIIKGFVISTFNENDSKYGVGYYSDRFYAENFQDWTGSITLTQE
jgi:hypothetical protein